MVQRPSADSLEAVLAREEACRFALVETAKGAARLEARNVFVRCVAVAGVYASLLADQEAVSVELAARERAPVGDREEFAAEQRWAWAMHADAETARKATVTAVSLALGVGLGVAARMVDLALAVADHPRVGEALHDGAIDERQATVLASGAQALTRPADQSRLLEAFLSDSATSTGRALLVPELRHPDTPIWGVPAHRLDRLVTRQVAALDPAALVGAEARAQADRAVTYSTGRGQGPATVALTGPEHVLTEVMSRLDATARAARKAGAPQTLDQLRFDLAAAHLTEGAHGLTITSPMTVPEPVTEPDSAAPGDARPRARRLRLPRPAPRTLVQVTTADTTLAGLDDAPGALRTPTGDCPVSAPLTRYLATATSESSDEVDDRSDGDGDGPDFGELDALWQTITTHPTTGTATGLSRTYRPPQAVADFVRARDGHTTRFPTSNARTLDIDHVVPYDHARPHAGGPTHTSNLGSAGRYDHNAKTRRLITVSGNANETLTYRDLTGHTYSSRPRPYTDPDPDPPVATPARDLDSGSDRGGDPDPPPF